MYEDSTDLFILYPIEKLVACQSRSICAKIVFSMTEYSIHAIT